MLVIQIITLLILRSITHSWVADSKTVCNVCRRDKYDPVHRFNLVEGAPSGHIYSGAWDFSS